MLTEIDIRKWFAAELKERMEEAGLRSYHMAYLCRVKQGCFYNYTQGTSLPNLWSLVLMAETLNCNTNDLLGFDSYEDIDYERYEASKMFADENQYALCLGDRLFRYIEKRGITIERLAEITQFNPKTITHWIGNRPRLMRTSDLLKFCSALDCTPSDLLGY